MSSASHASTAHESGHHDDHHGHHESGESHSTMKGYMTGFILSVILTVIPFWLVMARPLEDAVLTGILVVLFAVAQIIVHMIYFLHMDSKSEGGWTGMALIFTVVLVVITISGSLWVMYHLNKNMMPMGAATMQGMSMDIDGVNAGESFQTKPDGNAASTAKPGDAAAH
ncbi:cytochrome o ubiquinol oxidase subunit IV [Jiella sp. CQZ9-1]|uniref:Cytochrome bo(3) ubiquinol oxidase subunit 4 n=1 Tax=Jiella flava TaxID=2816857 RepID=A0A939FX64_9HYPH|nr:cytochrome o ubiquinol oxidase subunit IV [Jiella flava]